MKRIESMIALLSRMVNWIAAASIVGVMLLTVADIVLRFFRHPIPGAYEIAGMLGGMAVAFSLAYTSVEKGHIAVDLLVERIPTRLRALITGIYSVISAMFFGIVSWQCMLYGLDIQRSGEVSLSIRMPLHPFVYGMAFGLLLLTAVLVIEAAVSFRAAGRTR